jgi:hypothetical protein
MDLIINVLKIGRVMDAIGISKSVKYMYNVCTFTLYMYRYMYVCKKKYYVRAYNLGGTRQLGP